MTTAEGMVPRYKWMANDGRDLFTWLVAEVAMELGDTPLAYGTLNAPRRNSSFEASSSVGGETTFKYFDSIGRMLTATTMEAINNHRTPDGKTVLEHMKGHRDLRSYLDIAEFPGIEEHMADTFDFAFRTTFGIAVRALSEAPFTDSSPKRHIGLIRDVKGLLARPGFVNEVLEPLASTGFAVFGNVFVSSLRGSVPLRFSKSRVFHTQLVEWTQHGDDWNVKLKPAIRTELVKAMKDDGRTRTPHRVEALAGGGTSSGCPVRHGVTQDDGTVKSGIALTTEICVAALDQMLVIPLAERTTSIVELG